MTDETRAKAIRCLMNCNTKAGTHFPVCFVCGEFVSVLRNPVLRHQAILDKSDPTNSHLIEVVTFKEAYEAECQRLNLAPSPYWWKKVAWNIGIVGEGMVTPMHREECINMTEVDAYVKKFIKQHKNYK